MKGRAERQPRARSSTRQDLTGEAADTGKLSRATGNHEVSGPTLKRDEGDAVRGCRVGVGQRIVKVARPTITEPSVPGVPLPPPLVSSVAWGGAAATYPTVITYLPRQLTGYSCE